MIQKTYDKDLKMGDSDICEYLYEKFEERVKDNDYNTPLVISRKYIEECKYSSEIEFEDEIITPIINSLAKKYNEDLESLKQKFRNCIDYV